ncbi:MAG: hypothetical protein KG075_07490 [Alphaproteobacteria bacterium]|nr:hypothetical protein [Alphaproteobacteria bacterium]
MRELLVVWLPWLLSAITITLTLLAGNKHPLTWLLGLASQALWLLWICVSATWGLLPMNIALAIIYARNHLKWRRELRAETNSLSASKQTAPEDRE